MFSFQIFLFETRPQNDDLTGQTPIVDVSTNQKVTEKTFKLSQMAKGRFVFFARVNLGSTTLLLEASEIEVYALK